MGRLYDMIMEQVKDIDTAKLSDEVQGGVVAKVTEEQKVYIWIRLFLRQENTKILAGDDVSITWTPSGEKLKTKFICYGKEGLSKDHSGEVASYNPEDDTKILCLMVDVKDINLNDSIPFIRTLFKEGIHYEYQLVRRDELTFTVARIGENLEYYDCNF